MLAIRLPLIVVTLTCLAWSGAVAPAAAQVQQVAAYTSGRTLGVGQLTVKLPRDARREVGDDGYLLTSAGERVVYGVMRDKPVQRVLRNLLNQGRPIFGGEDELTVYFLFLGEAPLELTFHTPQPVTARVVPQANPPAYERLLSQWWREYTGRISQLAQSKEYPLLVETYLAPTLARRLNLRLPVIQNLWGDAKSEVDESLELLMGAESLEGKLRTQTLLGIGPNGEAANLPLPEPVAPPLVLLPAPPEELAIEPLAQHVPEESLYVRFGNFNNYLWFRTFLQSWGGDIRSMLLARSLDYRITARQETQLALRESALAEVLGPRVVRDVAFVGFDTLLRQGPAFGILFHANSNEALAADLDVQRQAVLRNNPAAKLTTVRILDRDVSFLSTPDNRVRSFYAVDGDFHLVTTSRRLVERFFEAGQGKGSLADLTEFRAARATMPGDQTVFAYLSEPFFRQLVSPQYRIEMVRRTQSQIEIEAWKLARLSARAEGMPAHSIEELIAAGLLPENFGRRPDGSQLVEREGEIVDSLRGATRAFLPVADVEIAGVTLSEAQAYERFREFFRNQWHRMDPVVVGVQRNVIDPEKLERLTIEMHALPYLREHYGMAGKMLGQPTTAMVPPAPGDFLALDLVLGRPMLGGAPGLGGPAAPPAADHHLFGGIRDFQIPLQGDTGQISLGSGPLSFIRGYLGAWPEPGMLSLFMGLPGNQLPPDAQGYTPILRGLAWQRQFAGFTVLSLKRDVLEAVTPQLRVVEAERPAQVRLAIVDPTVVGIDQSLNGLAYVRARQATLSNTRFMNRLSDQLRVPRAEARTVGESLLQARFMPVLGGDYELQELPGGLSVWRATAVDPSNQFALTSVPDDFQLPLLKWFRGLSGEVRMGDPALSAYITLDMQPLPTQRGFRLPNFPSLPGFGN